MLQLSVFFMCVLLTVIRRRCLLLLFRMVVLTFRASPFGPLCHAAHRAGKPSLPWPVPGRRVSIADATLQPAFAGALTGQRCAPAADDAPAYRRVGCVPARCRSGEHIPFAPSRRAFRSTVLRLPGRVRFAVPRPFALAVLVCAAACGDALRSSVIRRYSPFAATGSTET